METYIFDDDEVGRQFSAALIAAHQRGVRVSLIRDSVGTLGKPNTFFQQLTDSGIAIVQFNPVNPPQAKAEWQVNLRDHRKLLIVDGRIVLLGGINISNVYSRSSLRLRDKARTSKALPWRDTDLKIQGPVVNKFQRLFIQTWAAQGGSELVGADYFPALEQAGNEVVRAIGSSPQDPYSQIYVTLIAALHRAQSEVWISNAYFVPDPQLLAALKQAATRGVDVRLLLPSSSDSWLVLHAGHAHYRELLQAGVSIYERRNALLHVKTAVIDGVWSTVGSTNLDWRSFLHN
jgi:cardiolipin synthase